MKNLLLLFAALLLLLPPMPLAGSLKKSFHSLRRGTTPKIGAAARLWQNWADLVRAALGTGMLITALPVNRVGSEPNYAALVGQAVILGLALLVQTVRFFRGPQLLSPVFYLCGVTLVMSGDSLNSSFQGSFAVIVGWLFATCGKNLTYELPAMGVALVAAGCVLGISQGLLLNCVLILAPLVVSAFSRKGLLYATV
jgi:hypothetical protein